MTPPPPHYVRDRCSHLAPLHIPFHVVPAYANVIGVMLRQLLDNDLKAGHATLVIAGSTQRRHQGRE